jgi:CheY-like chemotaxis protein
MAVKMRGMDNSPSLAKNIQARILIVDDHPNTARTLARAVSQLGAGLDIITAENGETALELVRDKNVDILVTDMVMPGINGLELIKRLQAHPGGRPSYVALITAYDVPGLKETARRMKVNDVINKPVRPERLCQILAKAIEELGRESVLPAPDVKAQLKILVADDLADNVTLLTRYLENEGYLCISASNGVEALAKIRAEMPDLVLLDVNMPVKDGFETLQEIRGDAAIGHIPVIILTAARIEPMDMQYALSIGADDYITKPFDRRELLARIRTRLRVKETEDIIRRRNKELNLLPEIGRELSARLDVDELIDLVLRRTVETLGALLGHVVLLTPGGPRQKTYRFSLAANPASAPPLPSLENILGRIRETRQGLIIENIHKDVLWQADANDPTRTVVIVPMFGRFDLLGVLILAHEQAGYFRLEQRLLLQAIASLAAIALENAQLYAHATGGLQNPAAGLQGVIEAALIFDKDGHLVWAGEAGKKLFPDSTQAAGGPVQPGHGYDALIELLEEVRSSRSSKTAQISWPDGRIFTTFLAPLEEGGVIALLHSSVNS